MTNIPLRIRPSSYARIAGLIYLVIAVFGGFSIGYVPSVIVATGDAAETANNLLENLTLFKLGIFADVVVLLAEVILTAMLFVLFRPVSRGLALIAAFSRLAMVLVMAVNILLNILPVLLLSGASYLSVFGEPQLQAMSLLLFDAHALGVFIWQLFFAVHLVALGYVVIKSGLFPAILGWMMLVGSFGYLVQGLTKIMFVENGFISALYIGLLVLVTLGELAFAFWLLIKAVDEPQWNRINA